MEGGPIFIELVVPKIGLEVLEKRKFFLLLYGL
jgi:hypothetical protein